MLWIRLTKRYHVAGVSEINSNRTESLYLIHGAFTNVTNRTAYYELISEAHTEMGEGGGRRQAELAIRHRKYGAIDFDMLIVNHMFQNQLIC